MDTRLIWTAIAVLAGCAIACGSSNSSSSAAGGSSAAGSAGAATGGSAAGGSGGAGATGGSATGGSAAGGSAGSGGSAAGGSAAGGSAGSGGSAAGGSAGSAGSGTGGAGGASSGNDYYVSNSGNDSNSGTSPSSSWKTIAKVMSFEPNLKPGDSVLFQRGGVWDEQLDISNVNGTPSAPITFGNYGTGNLPVIDGGSTRKFGIVSAYSSSIGIDDGASTYVTVNGFEVRNTTLGGIIFTDHPATGVVIENNYVHNTGYGAYPGACSGCFHVDDNNYGFNEGIAFFNWQTSKTGIKILNNKVQITGGHNSIMVDGDTGGPVIQGNSVGPGCSHNCIDFKASVGVTIAQNTVNCMGTVTVNGQSYPSCNGNGMFALQHPSFTMTVTFKQNVDYGAASGYACFGLQTQGGTGPIQAKIYNNTCYAGSTGMVPFYIDSCAGGTLDIENNVLDGGRAHMGSSCSVTWDYNDTYQSTGGGSGPHDLSVDPSFVNPGAMNFHLKSGSPVLNAGKPNLLPGVTWMGALGL